MINVSRERVILTQPATSSDFGLSKRALSHNLILFANSAAKLFPPRRCTSPMEYRSLLRKDCNRWIRPDIDCAKRRAVVNQFHMNDFLEVGRILLLGRTQPPLTVTAATNRSMAVPGTPVHHGSARSKATGVTVIRVSGQLPTSVILSRGKRNADAAGRNMIEELKSRGEKDDFSGQHR